MNAAAAIRQEVDVCIGQAGIHVGRLIYVQQGRRENATFAYAEQWLHDLDRFRVSPDLELVAGYQSRRAPSAADSTFHFAIADTAPDAWGRRIIARDHAKQRRANPALPLLTEMDCLLAVDDFSRVGALRLRDDAGVYRRTVEPGRRTTPPLIELQRMYEASRAVERGQETTEDLRYLQGKGTSLGGMRPKCTVLDENGWLAIGKFPSVNDTRSVTRGEVLALRLAQTAGIDVAAARVVTLDGAPVAVIRRFDRAAENSRIPYLSAASMLQASREEERAYVEIADAIRAHGAEPTRDTRELWRRMVFNLLITNVDDHLQNHGFLHAGNGFWRLAPAFDLNPFPDKVRESKTWLSEEDGPVVDIPTLLARSNYFSVSEDEALTILGEVHRAVADWRRVAISDEVGLRQQELEDFAPAFEHEQMEAAKTLLDQINR